MGGGTEEQDGTHQHNLESLGQTQPMSGFTDSVLSDVNSLQKLGTFVVELNTHTRPRSKKLKEAPRRGGAVVGQVLLHTE